MEAADPIIRDLVLTGGPSAGKTTSLTYISSWLQARGWHVLRVPEAATLLITGGVDDIGFLATHDRPAYLALQRELTGLQLHLRERFRAIASSSRHSRVVLLHDRGILDNGAYMTASELSEVLAHHGLTVETATSLYDAVIHLCSAAVPVPGYDGSGYTVENNPARHETDEQARALDSRIMNAWAAHQHLAVVPPQATLEAKLDRVAAAAVRVLGDPDPARLQRKFLLRQAPDLGHEVLAASPAVEIEQLYLPSSAGNEQRLRRRTLAGVSTYWHASKIDRGDGARVESESLIDERAFRLMAQLADPGRRPIHKTRRAFVDGGVRFLLDQFHQPEQLWLLEAEIVTAGDEIRPPSWLGETLEVSNDPRWRSSSIAAR